jgi:hypothetical protein
MLSTIKALLDMPKARYFAPLIGALIFLILEWLFSPVECGSRAQIQQFVSAISAVFGAVLFSFLRHIIQLLMGDAGLIRKILGTLVAVIPIGFVWLICAFALVGVC